MEDLESVLRYECFFGYFHVKSGVKITCILTIFGSCLVMFLKPTYLYFTLGPGIMYSLFAIGPLLGIYTVKAALFLPYLILWGLTVTVLFLGNFYSLFVYILTPAKNLTFFERYGIIVFPPTFILCFWIFNIVYCCYDYIRVKEYLSLTEKNPQMV